MLRYLEFEESADKPNPCQKQLNEAKDIFPEQQLDILVCVEVSWSGN